MYIQCKYVTTKACNAATLRLRQRLTSLLTHVSRRFSTLLLQRAPCPGRVMSRAATSSTSILSARTRWPPPRAGCVPFSTTLHKYENKSR